MKCRSYRRFYQDVPIEMATLRDLVDAARCTASQFNRQPLRYALSCLPDKNQQIFACLRWAAVLKDWKGPPEGERPAAYVVILGDKGSLSSSRIEVGIAAQTILLAAVEKGLGGCMMWPMDRDGLHRSLNIPTQYDILLVIALGKPKETVVMDVAERDGSTVYFRDEDAVHHVPKRRLVDIIVAEYGNDIRR